MYILKNIVSKIIILPLVLIYFVIAYGIFIVSPDKRKFIFKMEG